MTPTETETESAFEIDRAAHTIRFSRHLPARPARVFAAWTDPASVTQWWDPTGAPLAECEIDAREGGAFRFVNQGHPDHPFVGTYTRLDPPNGFDMAAMGATSQTRFTPEGQGTRMVMEMRCASAEHLEQFLKLGIAEGTAKTLANLGAHLAG
ncbi:SRPBCC domain-containing protein [Pseudoroseicyclus sp. CXY001]|uniref:SRPBCC family protein n=1 Tax=Pseudoroseicyclus sp. CXY001 TaxID=3242492 RepID=UPI00358DD347